MVKLIPPRERITHMFLEARSSNYPISLKPEVILEDLGMGSREEDENRE